MQSEAAKAAGLPVDKVIVNNHLLGGGFGRKLEPDMVVAAVRIAKQVDGPVKVVWTREEDIQHDVYRPVYRDTIAATLGRRQDRRLEIQASPARPLSRAGCRRRSRRASTSTPSIAPIDMPYDIPNFHVEYVRAEPPAVPTGFWRGVGPTTTCSRSNASMDELARKAGKDPIEFRRAMLGKQPRLLAALNLVAEKSGWGQPLPARVGRGVCMQPSFGSFIATVVEAEVDEQGEVHLRRVTSAVDTGIAVNPDTIMAQLEGGLIFGLTAALYGEITIDKGRVQQSNFHDYRMLRIDQVPKIEIHVIKSGEPPGGIGETGSTAGPPALRNAIYAATGVALRRLPIDRALHRGEEGMSGAGTRFRQHRRDHRWRRSRSPPGSSAVPGPLAFADGPKVALSDYKGAKPTGVPAKLAQASLVERGEYLAKAADCMVCHTAPGGKEYAGGLGFKLPFGTLYSTNITPDKDTGIGNYSDQDFLNALHRGVRRDGARLYPAMPYTSYTYISDEDALAIKAYLFSLPPVRATPPENTLALSVQPALGDGVLVGGVQSGHPLRAGQLEEPGMEPRRLSRRGARALRRMPYAAQSRLRTEQPPEIRGRRDRGLARLQHQLRQGNRRRRLARRRPDLISLDRPCRGSWHRVGPDGRSGRSQLQPASRLRTSAPSSPTCAACRRSLRPTCRRRSRRLRRPRTRRAASRMRAARRMFEGACVSCHGWTGESAVSPFATLTGAWAVNDPAATNVAQIVISGTKRHTPDGVLSMPAFGNAYSDDEIAAVANYVTARFGSQGSKLTAQDVAELRKQTAN